MIWRILFLVLAGYVAICVLVFVFQRKLLYFPFGSQLSEESASREGLLHWPSLESFQGFISQEELLDPLGTIIIFHGNAGTAYHRSFYIETLSKLNMRVILAEYPGYGGRDGQPSEEALVNDALDTISHAYQQYDEPIFLWGESLGSGVVSSVIRNTDIPIEGVVLFLTWGTLPDLAQTHYWYLPAQWLVLDKYNNIENLQGYEGKIAVLLAEEDEVIPVQHGKKLYESLEVKKKLWMFELVTHNEIPVGSEQIWWEEVIDFISQ